jgi:DNA-binding transcriptional MerR regulator
MEPGRATEYHVGLRPIGSSLAGDPGGRIDTFTISALERATGVPRSTIHFYISEELLPRPAKTAASRALYSEDHVELLRRITKLKQTGLSLAEIKDELETELSLTSGNGIDLAAHEYERIHAEIIRTATQEFVANGYEDTHLATITKKIGTTPHVLYRHFASKRQLFAECFRVMIDANLQSVESMLQSTPDLSERLLARLASNVALHTLQSEAVSLIRAEAPGGVSDDLVETYAKIVERVTADMRTIRPAGARSASVPIELLAYSMLGAFDNTQLRASWDDKYDRLDLFRTHLWLHLAVRAALDGRVDIDSELEAYEDLIRKAASDES